MTKTERLINAALVAIFAPAGVVFMYAAGQIAPEGFDEPGFALYVKISLFVISIGAAACSAIAAHNAIHGR